MLLLLLLFYLLREILRRDHSYETSLIVLSHGTIFFCEIFMSETVKLFDYVLGELL